MCVTNYLVHRYENVAALPEDPPDSNMYERARVLQQRLECVPLAPADIRAAMHAVRVEGPEPVARTMWSALYDLTERSVTLEFYLGESAAGPQRRSGDLTYALSA